MNPQDPQNNQPQSVTANESESPVTQDTPVVQAVLPQAPVTQSSKKSSAGVFALLVIVAILLFGAAGYFAWQTINNVSQGSTQAPTGGDVPDLQGKQQ